MHIKRSETKVFLLCIYIFYDFVFLVLYLYIYIFYVFSFSLITCEGDIQIYELLVKEQLIKSIKTFKLVNYNN